MKLAPFNSSTTQQIYGAFLEGAMPDPLNYDLQTVLNNMLSARSFTAAPSGGQFTATPNTVTAYQVSPAPAWTTVQGYRGKRVLPKVNLPTYSTDYANVLSQNSLTNVALQLDQIFFTILAHRCASTTVANLLPFPANATASLPQPRVQNTDGSWTIAEYDFGADVAINSLASLTFATGSNNVLVSSAPYMVFLQVQNGSSWTDVTSVTANLFNASAASEKYFQLPSTVTGRRFRLVTKAANVATQWSTGFGQFALHFYGDYVSGASPRTLSKIGHMVGCLFAFATSFTAIPAVSNQSGYNYGRVFNHFGLSVTDDLKVSASNDILMPDATVIPAQEQLCPSLVINLRPVTLENY
ncbi:hypothetical protein pEaSNUABM13_00087 [Erwinia phage pEa_SNUABM_13]|nr:hypothetical protein pEaSNUABM13_00087 [Erwinia phage pEa_SNUABM_13]